MGHGGPHGEARHGALEKGVPAARAPSPRTYNVLTPLPLTRTSTPMGEDHLEHAQVAQTVGGGEETANDQVGHEPWPERVPGDKEGGAAVGPSDGRHKICLFLELRGFGAQEQGAGPQSKEEGSSKCGDGGGHRVHLNAHVVLGPNLR